MQDIFLYSTRCVLKEYNPSIRQAIDKTYCSASTEPGREAVAQSFIPQYERILETRTFKLSYPSQPTPATASPFAVSSLFSGCTRCGLCHHRKTMVHFRGFETTKIVFVGMAPGDEEDREGKPFVGPSGQLLEEAMMTAGFSQPSLIMNVVACRPNDGPGTTQRDDPKLEEMTACSDRLWLTLNSIKPNFLIALGRIPARMVFDEPKDFPRNSLFEVIPEKMYVAQTYHPSYILRVMRGGTAKELDDLIAFLRLLDKKVAAIKPFPREQEWFCTREAGEFPFCFLNDSVTKKQKKSAKQKSFEEDLPF